jgi:fructose-bisphosphate aldolase class II
MFISSKTLLRKARRGGYALPAFNTSNLETSKALLAAAEKAKSPLLIQITESTIKYAGLESIFAVVQQLEKHSKVPVCIHLDHGKHLPTIRKCLSLGFRSVMVDASRYSLKKNVAITKKAVSLAKRRGCSVEAELGSLKRIGSRGQNLTDPNQARLFVEATGCDSLAVAIGTSHGAHKFKAGPKLDFERLGEISETVSIPLVLHGASSVPSVLVKKNNQFGARLSSTAGVPDKDIKRAIKLGVSKINIDTDLRLAFSAGIREFHSRKPKDFDPRHALKHASSLVQEVAGQKIAWFGARGRA